MLVLFFLGPLVHFLRQLAAAVVGANRPQAIGVPAFAGFIFADHGAGAVRTPAIAAANKFIHHDHHLKGDYTLFFTGRKAPKCSKFLFLSVTDCSSLPRQILVGYRQFKQPDRNGIPAQPCGRATPLEGQD